MMYITREMALLEVFSKGTDPPAHAGIREENAYEGMRQPTFRNHGLDGERVSGLHDADGLVLGVVRHVGSAVEQLVDA